MASPDILAEIYTAAADEIENTHYVHWQAGPRLWGILSRVQNDLFLQPAAEGIIRHVQVVQLQFWDADQDGVVKTLRELAGEHEQLDVLREASADHQILAARRMLAEALGWPAEDAASLGTIARTVAEDLHRLKSENDRLCRALEEARRQRAETTEE